jgi:hypothetical protein
MEALPRVHQGQAALGLPFFFLNKPNDNAAHLPHCLDGKRIIDIRVFLLLIIPRICHHSAKELQSFPIVVFQ